MCKSCHTCEFNFGYKVCAGYGKTADGQHTYGMSIADTLEAFPNGCSDWGISLQEFIKQEQSKEDNSNG